MTVDKAFEGNHLLLIPTFNCSKQVINLINDFKSYFHFWSEIWFVDNGSQDATVSVIMNAISNLGATSNNVSIYVNSPNIGLGGTHKTVFLQASSLNFTSVTVFHGDYQARVEDAIKAIEEFKRSQKSFVLGSRFMPGSTLQGYSKTRYSFNLLMNFLFGLRFRRRIFDLGSGLNVFSVKEMQGLDLDLMPNDLTFNIELLKWIISEEKHINWLPIYWGEDDQVSNVKVVRQTLKTLNLLIFPIGRNGKPLPPEFKQVRVTVG